MDLIGNKPNMTNVETIEKLEYHKIKCTWKEGNKICGMILSDQDQLIIHMKNHQNHKPNIYCDNCDEEFFTRNSLDEHMCAEQDENFNCNECDFQEGRESVQKKHIKTTGQWP